MGYPRLFSIQNKREMALTWHNFHTTAMTVSKRPGLFRLTFYFSLFTIFRMKKIKKNPHLITCTRTKFIRFVRLCHRTGNFITLPTISNNFLLDSPFSMYLPLDETETPGQWTVSMSISHKRFLTKKCHFFVQRLLISVENIARAQSKKTHFCKGILALGFGL